MSMIIAMNGILWELSFSQEIFGDVIIIYPQAPRPQSEGPCAGTDIERAEQGASAAILTARIYFILPSSSIAFCFIIFQHPTASPFSSHDSILYFGPYYLRYAHRSHPDSYPFLTCAALRPEAPRSQSDNCTILSSSP